LERNDASLKEQLKCILESICNPSQGLLTWGQSKWSLNWFKLLIRRKKKIHKGKQEKVLKGLGEEEWAGLDSGASVRGDFAGFSALQTGSQTYLDTRRPDPVEDRELSLSTSNPSSPEWAHLTVTSARHFQCQEGLIPWVRSLSLNNHSMAPKIPYLYPLKWL
jgi:hypothetical protein